LPRLPPGRTRPGHRGGTSYPAVGSRTGTRRGTTLFPERRTPPRTTRGTVFPRPGTSLFPRLPPRRTRPGNTRRTAFPARGTPLGNTFPRQWRTVFPPWGTWSGNVILGVFSTLFPPWRTRPRNTRSGTARGTREHALGNSAGNAGT